MYYITNNETTHAGIWPRTPINTYYGYKINNIYIWYKTKKTVLRHLKGTKNEFYRATKMKSEMYINLTYLTLTKW